MASGCIFFVCQAGTRRSTGEGVADCRRFPGRDFLLDWCSHYGMDSVMTLYHDDVRDPMPGWKWVPTCEEARLIAAAPKMLAALKLAQFAFGFGSSATLQQQQEAAE